MKAILLFSTLLFSTLLSAQEVTLEFAHKVYWDAVIEDVTDSALAPDGYNIYFEATDGTSGVINYPGLECINNMCEADLSGVASVYKKNVCLKVTAYEVIDGLQNESEFSNEQCLLVSKKLKAPKNLRIIR